MKLRLLLFSACNRRCEGCCNKQWDLDELPVLDMDTIGQYDEVILTGGEPMLNPRMVREIAYGVPLGTKVFFYTAKTDDLDALCGTMLCTDGVTVTLHEQADVDPFLLLVERTRGSHYQRLSLRVNVFKGVRLPYLYLHKWNIKDEIEWIPNCPLPTDEVFMRLEYK